MTNRVGILLALVLCLSAASSPALTSSAQTTPGGDPNAAAVEAGASGAPDSPRASLTTFLDLCREGRYDEAADYLDLPPRLAGDGPRTARRLKAVLDHHIWFDLDLISGAPRGDTGDGLPPGTEKIGAIPGATGNPEPVTLVRRESGDEALWVFSSSTVARVEDWFGLLGNSWLLDNLPDPLLKPGPRNLLWWQWLALPILAFVSWGIGRVLAAFTRVALARLARRTRADWDDAIIARVNGPVTLAWTIIVLGIALPWLDLYAPAEAFLQRVNRGGLFLVFFWAALRTVDIGGRILSTSRWSASRPETIALIPLGTRVAKVLVAAIAVIAVVSELGYPVASLLAGLGLGGLAFALAAQKTVENMFGAFSIGVDQPIREGDFVRVDDFVGTVEQIGLRSTRFRTLDRTVISIPNGRLADMRLETFAERDRIRLSATLGVIYSTTSAQMKEIIAGFERVMREHPKIWPDTIVARFAELADFSLNIEIMCWFLTTDFNEFRDCRQDVLLGFMEVVENAGSEFAFPTRTIHAFHEGWKGPGGPAVSGGRD